MYITKIEFTIDKDEMADKLASEVDSHLEGAQYDTEGIEIDTDGTLSARVGADVYWPLDEVESMFRQYVMPDMDTGDFDEPGLCSMDKSLDYNASSRDYIFGYDIPVEGVDRQAEIDQLNETIRVQNERLKTLEHLRQLLSTQITNFGGEFGNVITPLNVVAMEKLLNTIRWGSTEAQAIIRGSIQAGADMIQTETKAGRRKEWRTPPIN